MKLNFSLTLLLFLTFLLGFSQEHKNQQDSLRVKELNESGYNIRLTDPEQSISYGEKALALSRKINYIDGIAEAYRIIGVGHYYLGKSEKALSNYLASLSFFSQTRNSAGQAKVYNNIGNLYRDIDYDKGLEYFKQS